MQTKTEVILCSSCEGRGYIVGSTMLDYHRGEFSATRISCKTCDETGRMIKKTTISYEKFTNDLHG